MQPRASPRGAFQHRSKAKCNNRSRRNLPVVPKHSCRVSAHDGSTLEIRVSQEEKLFVPKWHLRNIDQRHSTVATLVMSVSPIHLFACHCDGEQPYGQDHAGDGHGKEPRLLVELFFFRDCSNRIVAAR